jgi:hypothetical protein
VRARLTCLSCCSYGPPAEALPLICTREGHRLRRTILSLFLWFQSWQGRDPVESAQRACLLFWDPDGGWPFHTAQEGLVCYQGARLGYQDLLIADDARGVAYLDYVYCTRGPATSQHPVSSLVHIPTSWCAYNQSIIHSCLPHQSPYFQVFA